MPTTTLSQSHPNDQSDTARKTVAVLGLGAMGARIAARLHDHGADVIVWNRSQHAIDALIDDWPLSVAASPLDAAAPADVVISFVTDDNASDAIWLDAATGALDAVGDGVAVEMSTITAHHAVRLAQTAITRHVRFLEAPVVGSRPQAEAGSLVVFAAGEPDTLEHARPTLDLIASAVHHVGPAGTAATLKLAVNGLFAAQVASYSEIITLLAASDIDTATAQRIISGLPITSAAMQRIIGLFDAANYSPNFPIRLVAKDLDYLARSATESGLDLPINAQVAALFDRATHSDAAELDIAGVITTLTPSLPEGSTTLHGSDSPSGVPSQ